MCRLAWETWWYTTPLASQLIRQQVGGYFFDVGLLRPCGKHAEEAEDVASMPRTLQSMPRTLRSMPRRPRTLPSMPRSCQASLHILGFHNYYCISKIFKLDKILIYLWGKKSSSHQLYI